MLITHVDRHPRDIQEVFLGDDLMTIDEFVAVARYGAKVLFTKNYEKRVNQSRGLVERFLSENRLIYGVTTGFGENVTKVISPEDAEELQRNIVLSHSLSVGTPLPREIVRGTLIMILLNLGQGYSGVRLEVLQLVADILNRDVTPFMPGEGSIGGLLAESHIGLVLIGEGQARYEGELMKGKEALAKAGLQPVSFSYKEGLAFSAGTTSVTAMGMLALYNALQAVKTADIAAAMSLEALKGTIHACDPRYHAVKKHEEQATTARNLLRILAGSEIAETYKNYRLQDATSLRGTPQMHGAVKKALKDAADSILNEMNSVSDNPIIYPEGDDGVALMGAHFDGSFVGIYTDMMSIAMVSLAKISERRIDRLVNHHVSELPSFLIANPGLNNGYMIPQYTAAGLLAEMRVLSHPGSVDSMPLSANQEDASFFGYSSAKKAYEISRKLEYILAIELMLGTQALDFHDSLQPSPATRAVRDCVRGQVPFLKEDRYLYPDVEAIHGQVHEGEIIRAVEALVGEIEL
ncbi:HAL/PAL/TAL family ammonia-lyase [Brevibacillus centrosporus]|uniref:HAL/PAL/TAL family ammonia-lyase n=1 Tax=Brevibacillus centrosporus TaxID=54910 RepID=UPI002E1E1BF9|nr:aromatic amino acid lyase [Brevibacillus centrosporus]